MSLNKVLLIGNLTRDPESRTTPAGQTVATFGLATNRSWNSPTGERQERTEFHNIVAWGKLAEIVTKFLTKGRKTYVEGRLQTREWQGQDGAKRTRTEIVADNIILLDRPTGNTGNGPFVPSPQNSEPSQIDSSIPAEDEIQLEDIPF